MATKYQIFVSSTYGDLKEERDRVIQGVLEMGHIPVGMEMFSAADEEQWQIIARHIDESDYYVVILAHRYGSQVGGISYTRKEYEYAVASGIPVIGFVIDSTALWPADRVDTKHEDVRKLQEFKTLVEKKPVGFWTSAHDLYGKSSVALVKAMATNPRTGWVRASSVIGPEVTAEISRLSSENSKLRDDLAKAQQDSARDRESALTDVYEIMRRHTEIYSVRLSDKSEWQDSANHSLSFIFRFLSPLMLVESSTEQLASVVAINSVPQGLDASIKGRTIPLNELGGILAKFMALDLMMPSQKRHPVSDSKEYWSLTELGTELSKFLSRQSLADQAKESEES